MKIIISHSRKQHAHRLVCALQKGKKLRSFYTSIYPKKNTSNKLLALFPEFTSKIEKISSDFLDEKFVIQTFLPMIVEVLMRLIHKYPSSAIGSIRDKLHDFIVSIILNYKSFDIFVGYERQSYRSFKTAKNKGKVTVLDLASLHPSALSRINKKWDGVIADMALLEREEIYKAKEYELADYILVLSNLARNSCIRAGIPKEKIAVVPLGVDIRLATTSFKADPKPNCFTVLFVANIRYSKGVVDLINTFIELNLSESKLLIIGGKGDASEYVKKYLSEKIEYIDYLDKKKLYYYYKSSSIFVLPSYYDSWGQVVCEAMSCGVPVIISKNTGSRDLVVDGHNGFVINVSDNKSLGEKIKYFYKNRGEIIRMGNNAKECVGNFTWDTYYIKINDFFDRITCD